MCGLGQPTIHLLDTAGPRGHVYLPVNGKFTKEAKCSPGHPASDDAPGPLVALQTGAAAVESSVEAPRKVKNRTPSDPAIPLPGIYAKKPKTPLRNHFPTLAAASSARARTRRRGTCVSPRGRGAGKRRYAETVGYRTAMNDDAISPLVTVRRPRRALRGGRQVRGRQTPNAVADTWDPSGKANERHGDGPTDERTSRRAPDGRGPGAGGRRRSGLRGGYGHSHGGQGPWRARSRRGARRGGSRRGALRGPCPSARHAAPPKSTRDDAGCQMSPAVETGHGGRGGRPDPPRRNAPLRSLPPPGSVAPHGHVPVALCGAPSPGVSLAAQLSGCVGAGPPSLPATPAPALRACSGHSQTPPPPRLTVLGPRAPVCPAPSFWPVFPPRTAPRPGPAERGSRQWGRGLRVAGSRTPAGPGHRDLWPPSCHVLSVTIWGGSAGEEDMSCATFPGSSLSTANWATCRFFFQGGRGPRQARAGGPAVGGPRPCLWSWRRDRWHLLSVLRAPCSG